MTLLPQHVSLVEELMAECRAKPGVVQWWRIGERMHIITDDYKILYDYPTAKSELDTMWEEWFKADPRPKREVQP